MFTSRYVKHSRLLLRHAQKYLRYKKDLLSASSREEIVTGIDSLRTALRERDHERIQDRAETLDKTLHKLTPVSWESHWRENCEVYAPPETLSHDFNVFPGRLHHRDEIIARGAVDTGDQVFVDKFSYNFVKPHRGGVFVFRTNHIFGIREDPETGSPFYIKRLAGLPGDRLRIDPPFLYVDGKKAEGYGFERVMSAKPPYRGYALGRDNLSQPDRTFTVPRDGYFALGANSYNSYDSRD